LIEEVDRNITSLRKEGIGRVANIRDQKTIIDEKMVGNKYFCNQSEEVITHFCEIHEICDPQDRKKEI
jgi:hypothetical protein